MKVTALPEIVVWLQQDNVPVELPTHLSSFDMFHQVAPSVNMANMFPIASTISLERVVGA